MRDVVVIGAGLAGLVAALRVAQSGHTVTVVAHGTGGLPLSQGTVDILGYAPDRVRRPLEALADLPTGHPYVTLGAQAVGESVAWLRDLLGPEVLVGDPAINLHLPTAVGALRPTALAQPSMVVADAGATASYAVVGVHQLKDFQADLIAGNLARSRTPDGAPVSAASAWVDLPAREREEDPSGLTYARALDDPAFARRFARAVADAAPAGDVVLLPAVLGLERRGVAVEVAEHLGRPVAEVPLPPPSVPGLRLQRALIDAVKRAGVRIIQGARVTGFAEADGRIESVRVAAAGGPRDLTARAVLHAGGGFESGAIVVDSRGAISEPLFGLPLTERDTAALVGRDYWAPHPLFAVGVRADAEQRALDAVGQPCWSNLFVAGGLVAGAERWREKSGDGIAVASAAVAAASMVKGLS